MEKTGSIRLYWDTIRYLRPVQIGYQIKKRLFGKKQEQQIKTVERLQAPVPRKIRIVIPELDCGEMYLERFHPEALLENRVRLLHETHEILDHWNVPEASHLWNYNLHYLEFLVPLAVIYKKTGDKRYLRKWSEYISSWLRQSEADSMEPYTISMRIPNLLICLELLGEDLKDETGGTDTAKKIMDRIYGQYRFLIKHTERSLLANHYFENLKTIVICGVLFDETGIFRRCFALLEGQIREQILPDGVHFERSMMYHRIILEDILRVFQVLESADRKKEAAGLIPSVRAMTSALENIEKGFDTVPLFNDAGNNVAKGKEQLLAAAKRLCGYEAADRAAFPDAGYYKLYSGNRAVLFDCGRIGPSYMCGHSHCDCLGFELSANGHKIFSNSGTGQYQGEKRQFFRSTRAHNTIMIDDREQSELWGEHRAARRISEVAAHIAGDGITGQYRSYQGDRFRRELRWEGNVLTVTDTAEAVDSRPHTLRQFFHLVPGYRYETVQDLVRVKDRRGAVIATLRCPEHSRRILHTDGELTEYAADFGQYLHKEVLEVQTGFSHRIRSGIEIKVRNQEETEDGQRDRSWVHRSADGADAGRTWDRSGRNGP